MPTNTQVTAAIVAGAVPPDRECIRGGTDVVQLVQDFCSVASNTTEIDSGSTNSIAQQALEQSGIALSTAQQALAAAPNRRSSGEPISIPTGDSAMALTWSPAMPDTNYEVRVTFYGTAAYPATAMGYHVEDGTRTVNGCTIRLNNIPANFKLAWVVEALG